MTEAFQTIRMEGKLFTSDHLVRVKAGDLPGITGKDYGRRGGRLSEEISRHWTVLERRWGVFQAMLSADPETAYERIRDYWLESVFEVLGFGHLVEGQPRVIEGKSYPILFEEKDVPIHIVPADQDLETGPDGTARGNPHSVLQEYLNRCQDKTWGILTNGLKIRVLRDNAASKGAQYVEFNLQALMSGQHFHEFGIFWRLLHVTRFTGDEPWIEKWMRESARQGVRAHKDLKEGVVKAILALGRGFLKHRKNNIAQQLESGALAKQDYYHELLRLVYRLIFLFVTEDRDLLLVPDSEETRKQRRAYMEHYSTQRLRRLARRSHGSKHHDAYEQLKLVMAGLKRGDGIPELALPGLNSDLWSPGFIPTLEASKLSNADLYAALRHLSVTKKGKQFHAIDYVHLDSEELGGIYETLLELHPVVTDEGRGFDLDRAAGNDRKTSGSYYTPPELVELTLDEALNPVLEEAAAKADPEKAILALKVCDPTVGSGHFIIGAARRIARRLAQVRTFEEEPNPTDLRHALRDVVANCIYGVDLNKMAVELCKVALWLEAIEPGKPLTYLEHRIKHGNGFFGATPKMLEQGIPDAAYKPLVLDCKATCSEWRKKNAAVVKALAGHERLSLFNEAREQLAKNIAAIDAMPSETVADIAQKEEQYQAQFERSGEYHRARQALDAICAAWTQVKPAETQVLGDRGLVRVPAITTRTVIEILDGTITADAALIVEEQRDRHRFFHWHLEFPEVFNANRGPTNDTTGWAGGFDCMIGNPPWERLKIQKEEWFSERAPEISKAANASKRNKLIGELESNNPAMAKAYGEEQHYSMAASQFIRLSNNWPLAGHGDVNTYAIFAELNRNLINESGRVGCIVQSGIVTDFHTRRFFQEVVKTQSLASITSFENREKLFPEVDSRMPFCILNMNRSIGTFNSARFVFYAVDIESARSKDKVFQLTAKDILAINPNTGTCPVFAWKKDADATKKMYARASALVIDQIDAQGKKTGEQNPWGARYVRMFDMGDDSGQFKTGDELPLGGNMRGNQYETAAGRFLPLMEGKIFWFYDHRHRTYQGMTNHTRNAGRIPAPSNVEKANPNFTFHPWYFVDEAAVELVEGDEPWPRIAYREISHPRNERTAVVSLVPRAAYSRKAPPIATRATLKQRLCLLANLSSLAFDYSIRNSISGTGVPFFVLKQAPVFSPKQYDDEVPWSATESLLQWISARSAELSLTAWDLEPAITEYGLDEPFAWNDERRRVLRAELDAAYFHLYGLSRDDVEHVLSTFPGVEKKERARYGEYATRRYVLAIYDAMAKAVASGHAYEAPDLAPVVETEEYEAKAAKKALTA